MGQQEIYNLLRKKQDWVLSKEILKLTGMSAGALYRVLRVLEKNGDITKEKAIVVIKNKNTLNKWGKHAWAYKISK